MAQKAITSFFSTSRASSSPSAQKSGCDESTSTIPLPVTKRRRKNGLSQYTCGSPATPGYFDGAENAARHAKFVHALTSKRPRDGRRREMKPFDLQFIELKEAHEDCVLLLQNGYKYQILGEDAYTAARVLGRSPVAGWRSLRAGGDDDSLYDRFASITFPVERLPVYIEKLVRQSLKVAVAKQLETSALKAQSANKRGPFRREVTNIYTRGTVVEELTASSTVAGPVLAICACSETSVLSVQPATGDACVDTFADTPLSTELETRLLHLQPSEVLVVGQLGGVARRLVDALGARVVCVPTRDGSPSEQCALAMREYLAEFGLDKALTDVPRQFRAAERMRLNGDALRALEIFTANGDRFGSLFWALDATRTAFGRRMLRDWVGAPLLDRTQLGERVEAVEEIMANLDDGPVSGVLRALQRVPDLERHLLQVFHARIEPRQLYWFLYFFDLLASAVSEPALAATHISSPLLDQLLRSLLPCQTTVRRFLTRINANNAKRYRSGTLDTYFMLECGELPEDLELVDHLHIEIASCRANFDDFLKTESKRLGIPLRLARALGEEDTFAIGVPKKHAAQVPVDWRRQGAVTTEIRFWAPFSLQQTKILKPLLEQLEIAAQQAFDNFVAELAGHFTMLRDCIASMATFDSLASLATISKRENYAKPEFVDGRCLEIVEGRHPTLELIAAQNVDSGQYIPNSVMMFERSNRAMIITGPNMGGKSSFVRQVALIAIMAQVGAYVPAERVRMSLIDAVFTRMGALDNMLRGESTFMVELKECANIMEKASSRSLVLLDEIGRGTSTMDGVAIAEAVLQYMVEDIGCFTLFITHYPSLCDLESNFPGALQNWSMDCAEYDDEVTFLYKVVRKRASKSYGINVARLAEMPREILESAARHASEMESKILERRDTYSTIVEVRQALTGENSSTLLCEAVQEEVPETQACQH